jgi:hypothetical protein
MILEVNVDEAGFTGTASVEVKSYQERCLMLKDLGISATGGEVTLDSNVYDNAVKINQLAREHVKSIDLIHADSETEIDSLDKLEIYQEGIEVLNSLSGYILNGVTLSKN